MGIRDSALLRFARAFGAVLMPILAEAGIDDAAPQVSEVYNTITGAAANPA